METVNLLSNYKLRYIIEKYLRKLNAEYLFYASKMQARVLDIGTGA